MPKITEKNLTWAFAMALMILASNALISYRDLMVQAQNTPTVVLSRRIIDLVAEIGSRFQDAELARRELLIDRDSSGSKILDEATSAIFEATERLVVATADRPDQRARVAAFRRSAARSVALLRESAAQVRGAVSRPDGDPAFLDVVRGDLDRIHREVREIGAAESDYLARRVEERREGTDRAFVTFSVASTLALATIATTYVLFRRFLRDRDQADRVVRESDARIKLLFDSVGEGIYGIDTAGRCTFCNPAALRLLGFGSVDDVLGRDMHKLIHHTHPDGSPYPPHHCPIYRTFHSGEGVLGVEDYFFRADGRPIPVEYRAHAIYRGETILGAVVTFVDIAPKRQAEMAMRLRDRALRGIGQGVFILDLDRPGHPIVYANSAFERLTGYDGRDWNGRGFALLDGGDSPAGFAEFEAAVRERREASLETLARRKDGSTFWNSVSLAPVEGPLGRADHLVGVITDISERQAHAQTLRISEERLRLMVESVRDYAIFSIDLAGLVSSWNAGAERLFGFVEREIVGRPAESLFTATDRLDDVPAAELTLAAAVGRSDDERWQVRADGSRFLASGLVTAVRDEAGQLLGFTKVARDITASKHAETELLAAKETAELAVRAKGTFLANMGHEFRTPLNAIIGYSEMLADEAVDRGVADFLPDLERIRASGHLLLKLINNVLDLSRIESGGIDLGNEPFDIGDLIRGVVRAVEPMAEQRGNVIQVEYPNDLGSLGADFPKVNQALVHLLSNAVKFTEAGTVIFRTARAIDAADRPWIVFSVIDDGIGMTRDEIARLFQPFVQADDSPARRFGGSGLGLTIAHRFCELMGGRIEVSSEPGRGSTFRMQLPAHPLDVTTDALL